MITVMMWLFVWYIIWSMSYHIYPSMMQTSIKMLKSLIVPYTFIYFSIHSSIHPQSIIILAISTFIIYITITIITTIVIITTYLPTYCSILDYTRVVIKDNGVQELILNRPNRGNAIHLPMWKVSNNSSSIIYSSCSI